MNLTRTTRSESAPVADCGSDMPPSASSRFFRGRPAHESIEWGNETAIIWHPSEAETHYEQPKNSFCRFRHTFELIDRPERGSIRLFADSRYMLYVNGRYVGRGPGRSDPRWQYYDSWDLTGFLEAGENTIAVLALHFGYGTGQSMHRIPALLAECAIGLTGGERIAIGTSAKWKASLHPAYDRSAPRINGCQGPIEIFDARLEDGGWMNRGYDDTDWDGAKARNRKLSPFWNLVPREIALLEEGSIRAGAVINRGELREREEAAGKMHKQLLAEQGEIGLSEYGEWQASGYRVPRTEAGKAAVVTFDFGRLEVGYLLIEASGSSGDILDVVYAEELWQGKALLNADNNRSIDRFIMRDGINRFEVAFGYKACRYVQIRVRNPHGEVVFHEVGLRTRYYPAKRKSEFVCSDDRLNRLWEISAHTLRCCMQDGFLDSPSREQQQWMGDGRVQALYNYYYTGDGKLHAKLLRQFGQSQDWLGLTTSRYPDDHHNYPPIPSFCLQWVSSFEEYRQYTGDNGLESEWWPNIVNAIRWFTAYLNGQGLLEHVPYWSFIDWGELPNGPAPDVGRGGVLTALNLQFLEALHAASGMAERLGDREARSVFRSLANRLAEAIRLVLWDEEKGAYAECVVNGKMSDQISEVANSLALLHLHEPKDDRASRILENVFAGARPVIKASPYFMIYVYRALDKHGSSGLAFDLMRSRYDAMLDAGATTTWENWDLFYKTAAGDVHFKSASHAWAAMPLVCLPEQLLGLRPGDAGFARVTINPCLYHLEYAEGSISTPNGVYEIAVGRSGEQYRIKLSIPLGCEAIAGGKLYKEGQYEMELAAADCRSDDTIPG